MTARYEPTEMECRCLVCGDMLTFPNIWLDTVPPDRKCPNGASIVTDCPRAMVRARVDAWMIKAMRKVVM